MSIQVNIGAMRNPTRSRVKAAIEFNNSRRTGNGNRARRRAGAPVLDPYLSRPFGSIAMDRRQLHQFINTKD